MSSDNPILKHNKRPIDSGINRRLIAKKYQMGSAFVLKDGESYYNVDVIKQDKIVLQLT